MHEILTFEMDWYPTLAREGKVMIRMKLLSLALSSYIPFLCFACLMPAAQCSKKDSRTVTTTNGSLVRKIFIRAASPEMTSSAATQLTQDTCMATVSDPKQADAVLEVGIALPGLEGGGLSASNGFGSSERPQKMNGIHKEKPQRSFTATCSDGKESGGCGSSYTEPRGGVVQPAAEWLGNVGSQWDVLLVFPADTSRELWEADSRSKQSWSEQLRRAAGCPVCPGERFNRKRYASYRQWIEAKCPAVLTAQ